MRSTALIRLVLAVTLLLLVGLPGVAPSSTATAAILDADRAASTADVWTGVLQASTARQDISSGAEPTPTPAPAPEPTTRLIVRFTPQSGRASQIDAHQTAGAVRADVLSLPDTVRVEVPASTADAALASYTSRGDVVYAEPDYVETALETPSDPSFPSQWGMQKINAPTAWNVTHGAAGVRVAVVDCGVFDAGSGRAASDGQPGHPDLRGKVAMDRDFTGSSTGSDDFCNHGTHVAGIVAAATNNSIGVAGVGYNVTLINAKVLNDTGSGFISDIADGIVWSADSGAKVINMSLGRDGTCSVTEATAINYAWAKGAVVVAAAGNSGLPQAGAPGNCANVIAVAAVDQNDVRPSFSNYGTGVDVAAPGVGIISTTRDGAYTSFNGTSMASPHVAGLAGLIWSLNTNATPQSVVDRINAGASKISGTGSLWTYGRIDAAASVTGGSSPGQPTPTPAPTLAPTPVPCPSPRPAVKLSTSPSGVDSLTVAVQAGAGIVHQLDLHEIRNLSVDVGSQHGITTPIVYTPTAAAASVTLTMTQLTGGVPTYLGLTVTDDCGAWPTFLGSGANGFLRGNLSGIVRDAATSSPISGATVSVRGAQKSVTTDATGSFLLSDLPVGPQTLDISAGSYTSQSQQVTVSANQTATVNYALTSTLVNDDISITVTWGASPSDLDAHISGPTSGSQRFHLYWGAPNVVSYAGLVGDARTGFGPEKIVLRPGGSGGQWIAGAYRFWVHNFSGSPGFGLSSGHVSVTRAGQELGAYNVSDATGTATLPLWQVVTVNMDAEGHATLAPVQRFVNGSAGTALRFEDGSDPPFEWPASKP
jgi:thermitase